MKLAKKVLAIVMALGLIACMSAMAFAAGLASDAALAEVPTTEGDTVIKVVVYVTNGTGLQSGSLDVTFDPSIVQFSHISTGADANTMKDIDGNGFSADLNDTASANGSLKYGFFFTDNLWDQATMDVKAPGAFDNVNYFSLVVLNFKVLKADSLAQANIAVNGTGAFVDGTRGALSTSVDMSNLAYKVKVVSSVPETSKTEEEKKDDQGKPVEEEAKADTADAAKTNNGNKTAPKTDGGKNTGDNGVIAVVAGVIALAGAAFVVTKKRK